MTTITGNTYPVRRELRAMGGEWDAAKKAWMVPNEKAAEARALLMGKGKNADKQTYSDGYRPRRYGSRYTRFAGGGEHYVNRQGRCIDAPCCGCCS